MLERLADLEQEYEDVLRKLADRISGPPAAIPVASGERK